MNPLSPLQQRYQEYLQYSGALFAKAKPLDGIYGLGHDPIRDPGHEQFFQDVAQLVQALASQSPSPSEAEAAVRFLLTAESLAETDHDCWMLVAAHQHALPLIPFLSPADAASLLADYGKRYPKRKRLPGQNLVYGALEQRSRC